MRRLAIGIGVLAVVLGGLLAPSASATSPLDAVIGAAGTAARVASCRGASEATGTGLDARPMRAVDLSRCLRLNQVQSLGTHNSYHGPTTPEILDVLRGLDPASADSLEYSHPPLPDQFADEGIRQIELDVFADPDGGLYSKRPALTALGLPNPTPPELLQPGFKVLHIQDVDFNSTCLTFVICLGQVKAWSDAHPRHLPVAILVELKDDPIPDPFNLGFVTPIPIGGPQLDAVDAEIRSVFSEDQMITPDDVRGSYPTLESAVLSGNGWPTLADSQGKVMFLMDNASKRDLYRAGRPSLEGRVLFTNATPGSDDAAFVEMNDPLGTNTAAIQQLVREGYVVRTRADADTVQARTGDTTTRDAALVSGAQWVSTDYPVPGSSIWTDYFAGIPNGDPSRCNPVNAGPRCRNDLLEPFRSGRP
ncbi:MAG: phosphatidylinositol-specific phospholipase C1-like protein [Acidimicrobiales bacterium]